MINDLYNTRKKTKHEYIKMVREFCDVQNLTAMDIYPELFKDIITSDEGVSTKDLADMQTGLKETDKEPLIRPSEIVGSLNDPNITASEVFRHLKELERRFTSLVSNEYNGIY